MEEGSSKAFVDDDAVKFRKSLKELRVLSSQLYHIADYCETAFGRSRNKRLIVEGAKKYASEAVVTVVDHLGSISASLELTISRSNPVPDAQRRIDSLNQRIWTCQDQFHKVALARFRWHAELSRFHHRYISLPICSPATMSSASRDPGKDGDAFSCKNHLLRNFKAEEDNKVLVPVQDVGIQTLPRLEISKFRLQENPKSKPKPKHSGVVIKSKAPATAPNRAAALIRRGKRIILA
ncbi:probable protein ABIL5 isoform X2 [Andrographis paniculata]|uniref:probable protein ABIL5 isoform X2 n=1 Tax=Andrographis paniculata TaxID=175694 RepID=UPI0021E95B1A|nr:probable protein ABIL5 isoform X2 [Andrographis paniculata]